MRPRKLPRLPRKNDPNNQNNPPASSQNNINESQNHTYW